MVCGAQLLKLAARAKACVKQRASAPWRVAAKAMPLPQVPKDLKRKDVGVQCDIIGWGRAGWGSWTEAWLRPSSAAETASSSTDRVGHVDEGGDGGR
eukprot:10141526-Alexandrium_andersonii.AAC.1